MKTQNKIVKGSYIEIKSYQDYEVIFEGNDWCLLTNGKELLVVEKIKGLQGERVIAYKLEETIEHEEI